jgi:putative transposase
MIDCKGSHFEKEIILWGVRWYVASPISYRQLEEMMQERGVAVDHSTRPANTRRAPRCRVDWVPT